jgi:hypothetical protein
MIGTGGRVAVSVDAGDDSVVNEVGTAGLRSEPLIARRPERVRGISDLLRLLPI